MTSSSYNKEILATVAYAWINATGASAAGQGCSIQRVTTGVYKLTVPTGSGLVENQSFTQVQPKFAQNGPSPVSRYAVVAEVSDTERDIYVFDGAVLANNYDCDLEVVIRKGTASEYA